MKTLTGALITTFIWFGASEVRAEIRTYESTENAGQNKKERIDTVESYLINLSSSLQKMESKLDENAKKIQQLDQMVKSIQDKQARREAEEKIAAVAKGGGKKGEDKKSIEDKSSDGDVEKMDAKVGERTEKSEIDRLKADMAALKNQDMEKLKAGLEELSDTVKAIQATLKK